MAITLQPGEKDVRRLVQAAIELVKGRNNATGVVTLTSGAASTTISAVNCSNTSAVFLIPMTANAAAALTTTYIRPVDVLRGSFTITHANNGQTDRTFGW